MRPFVRTCNVLALLFSLWWLGAHMTRTRELDWEFWFAFGYLVLCGLNVFAWRRGRAGNRSP